MDGKQVKTGDKDHILQSATQTKTYSNAKDAKPDKATDLDGGEGDLAGFKSTVDGSTVTTVKPHDYVAEAAYVNHDGNAEINDSPGLDYSDPKTMDDRVDKYTFHAEDTLKEYPNVSATITMEATFVWAKTQNELMVEWSAKSSDGNIKESGTLK